LFCAEKPEAVQDLRLEIIARYSKYTSRRKHLYCKELGAPVLNPILLKSSVEICQSCSSHTIEDRCTNIYGNIYVAKSLPPPALRLIIFLLFAEDRQMLCKTYPDGNGLVFRCLQDNREKLKPHCREAVFDQVRGSQRKACF
jgi:hypothetical protein